MRSGIKGGQLNLISNKHIKKIHQAALHILKNKGIKIEEGRARKLLEENGCQVDKKTHVVKMPSSLVEEAIRKAPSSFELCGREEESKFTLNYEESFFTAGTGTTSVLDLGTEKRRKVTKEDVREAACLSDALPNIDMSWSIFTLSDDPMLGFYQLYALLAYNTKHIGIVNWYGEELTKKLIQMVAAVAGGRDQLNKNPLVTLYAEPVSPLTYRKENLETMLQWTKVGLPLIWYPAQKAGATSPMTLAGNLAQAFAESLGGNVIVQLNNPGTPVILGASPLTMDMRTAMNTYFSPETLLVQAAVGKWGRLIEIPTFGTGGCTNSYGLDFQAGMESALSLYGAVLGGQNLIHDLAFAGAGDVGSLVLLTLTDEIAGMIKRVVEGFEVSEETIALEVIEKIDHGGDYLREPHTLKHARSELFAPQLLKRIGQAEWFENYSVKKAKEKTKELLRNHRTKPLSKDVDRELKEIIKEAKGIMGSG